MKRINWIDYSKFFGIFLVVLGHTSIPVMSINVIYSFHMPLFFFISGYLFDANKFESFFRFMRHRLKQLIIPYFFFNIITYLFWFFVGRKFGNDSTSEISPLTPLMGIFYGTDTGNFLIHCGSLWFLPCLFLVELIYYGLRGINNRFLLLICVTLLAFYNAKSSHYLLPWSIDASLLGLLFYALGNISKTILPNYMAFTTAKKAMFVILSFALIMLFSYYSGRSDMSSNKFENFPMFLFSAISGICFMFFLSSFFEANFGRQKWIEFFSKNTLIILALHAIVASVIKGLLYFVFKVPVDIFEMKLTINIILSLVSFLFLIPVIFILNKYFPFLLGHIRVEVKK